jgi:hypothetical protein
MTGNDTRQKIQVVVNDTRRDRLRSYVDESGARLTQKQQQEQKAFFIGLYLRTGCHHVNGH